MQIKRNSNNFCNWLILLSTMFIISVFISYCSPSHHSRVKIFSKIHRRMACCSLICCVVCPDVTRLWCPLLPPCVHAAVCVWTRAMAGYFQTALTYALLRLWDMCNCFKTFGWSRGSKSAHGSREPCVWRDGPPRDLSWDTTAPLIRVLKRPVSSAQPVIIGCCCFRIVSVLMYYV